MLQIRHSHNTEANPKEMSQQNHQRARQGPTRPAQLVIEVVPERSQLPAPELYRESDFISLHPRRGVDNMQLPPPDLSIAYGFVSLDRNRRAPLQ